MLSVFPEFELILHCKSCLTCACGGYSNSYVFVMASKRSSKATGLSAKPKSAIYSFSLEVKFHNMIKHDGRVGQLTFTESVIGLT